ncbi:MAG: hypothetical protein ACFFAX_16640 [Promethearchaeota archaeon]
MTYAFIVFYRFQLMDEEKAKKARKFWTVYSKDDWPSDIKILGDYRHAWGSDWNGFLLLEVEKPERFFEFWPKFRDKTRFYLDNTRTIIGAKRDTDEWL